MNSFLIKTPKISHVYRQEKRAGQGTGEKGKEKGEKEKRVVVTNRLLRRFHHVGNND